MYVKQIVRVISRSGVTAPQEGFFSVEDVDAYLSAYVENGYRLFNTHYLGDSPEGYLVLYILEKPRIGRPKKE